MANLVLAYVLTNEAVLWLDGEDSDCNDAFFVERFALSAIHFALKISDVLMNKQDQCQWRTIFCSEGRVETLSLVNLTLEDRYVPSEIFLLQSLGELKLCEWIEFNVLTRRVATALLN